MSGSTRQASRRPGPRWRPFAPRPRSARRGRRDPGSWHPAQVRDRRRGVRSMPVACSIRRNTLTPRHTAHCRASLLTIHYRFHPCAGAEVEVRQWRHAPSGSNLYVRLLPSGRSLAIREWMTRPESAAFVVCDRLRLSREALSDLCMIIDSVACTLADDGGEDEARQADDTTKAAVRPGRTSSRSERRSREGTIGSPRPTDPRGGVEPGVARGRRT